MAPQGSFKGYLMGEMEDKASEIKDFKVIYMELLFPKPIEEYVEEHTSPVHQLLEELEKETSDEMENSQMLTGKVEGRLLKMLVHISGAQKVVDIGTFTGFSALMMAEGLPDNGELITCEISRKCVEMAQRYFKKSPHGHKIRLKLGSARETLRHIPDESIDFVFIDADKASYSLYYKESLRILRKGGLIAVDNTLWSGRVLNPQDEDSRAIALFNKEVAKDKSVEKVMLTVRDGIYLIRKKDRKS
jgi:caffeoyl-CoA O-methyltransferase